MDEHQEPHPHLYAEVAKGEREEVRRLKDRAVTVERMSAIHEDGGGEEPERSTFRPAQGGRGADWSKLIEQEGVRTAEGAPGQDVIESKTIEGNPDEAIGRRDDHVHGEEGKERLSQHDPFPADGTSQRGRAFALSPSRQPTRRRHLDGSARGLPLLL